MADRLIGLMAQLQAEHLAACPWLRLMGVASLVRSEWAYTGQAYILRGVLPDITPADQLSVVIHPKTVIQLQEQAGDPAMTDAELAAMVVWLQAQADHQLALIENAAMTGRTDAWKP